MMRRSATRGIIAFYDAEWTALDLRYRPGQTNRPYDRPARFDEAKRVAEALADGFAFVRVDLYLDGDAIYFNEMTFTPCAGQLLFSPPEWDAVLGKKWTTTPDDGSSVLPMPDLRAAA